MINTIIAYDNNDLVMGDYFDQSHNDIISCIEVISSVANNSINGLDCTEIIINENIKRLNGVKFIFIGLSHGNENELISHQIFVSNNNVNLFFNSFFYTSACLTGHSLGNLLIKSGCLTYIGYKDEVTVHVDYYRVFYECENYGIKSFLSNDEEISYSYTKMINYYDQEIDRLTLGNIEEVIAASYLISNRDCLIMLGEKTITRNDFN